MRCAAIPTRDRELRPCRRTGRQAILKRFGFTYYPTNSLIISGHPAAVEALVDLIK